MNLVTDNCVQILLHLITFLSFTYLSVMDHFNTATYKIPPTITYILHIITMKYRSNKLFVKYLFLFFSNHNFSWTTVNCMYISKNTTFIYLIQPKSVITIHILNYKQSISSVLLSYIRFMSSCIF